VARALAGAVTEAEEREGKAVVVARALVRAEADMVAAREVVEELVRGPQAKAVEAGRALARAVAATAEATVAVAMAVQVATADMGAAAREMAVTERVSVATADTGAAAREVAVTERVSVGAGVMGGLGGSRRLALQRGPRCSLDWSWRGPGTWFALQ
jgi:hypothetical protein